MKFSPLNLESIPYEFIRLYSKGGSIVKQLADASGKQMIMGMGVNILAVQES